MKTKTRPRRRAVVLPDDACPTCGTMMRRTQEALTSSVNGEEIRVPNISHLRCPKCGEGLFSLQEAEALRLGAFDIYRKKYGLLSADEIRAVREQHGLTQAELAQLLRLGGNTLSRWEAGRNVQTGAMDVLLRLIRDLPGSLEYLREHAA
jgi:putative zinc finger/helix-turn-helix YgiT family protein